MDRKKQPTVRGRLTLTSEMLSRSPLFPMSYCSQVCEKRVVKKVKGIEEEFFSQKKKICVCVCIAGQNEPVLGIELGKK